MSGASVVAFVRNSAGNGFTEVFRASRYLRADSNNVAEAHGCLLALITADVITNANVIIKGDSKIIIDYSHARLGEGQERA